MKKILTLLFLAIPVQMFAQNVITGINVTIPANPDANTANWGSGTSVFTISAATTMSNIKLALGCKILVTIKKGGSRICGSYTSATAPEANFNTTALNRVWTGQNAVSLLGQDCILKPGEYELCVQFFGAALPSSPLCEQSCKPFSIKAEEEQTYQAPQVISPAEGTMISKTAAKGPVIFQWVPVVPKPKVDVVYKVRIIEIRKGQTATSAMQAGAPIFEKEVINQNQLTGISLSQLPIAKDSKYAWYVQAVNKEGRPLGGNNGTSGPASFKTDGTDASNNQLKSAEVCSPTSVPWWIGGNDISNSNFYLGTCNDFPLAIGTNGIEKVRINTNGKVGIGTADPNYTLHVHSDELVSETPETLIFKSGSGKNIKADSQQSDIEAVDDELLKSDNLKTGVTASTGPTGTITFQMTNKTTGQGPDDGFQINLQNYNASINLKQPGNLFLKTSDGNIDMRAYGGNLLATAKEYRFMTSGTTLQHPALRIKNNGNIGIGVKDPIHNLQVNGNIAFQGQNSSLIFGQSFPTPTAEWGQWAIEYNRTTGGLNFWKPFNSNKFGNYYLFLSDNGNVLIGKSTQVNPIYKLDVEGAIRANEIVVNTTGADFVFENNYQLTSLVELEKSIRENKHLPGIPSATDMRKKGMPLGEMNTLLLQKIEEITLYLIDLQKDNDLLKDRLLKLEIK